MRRESSSANASGNKMTGVQFRVHQQNYGTPAVLGLGLASRVASWTPLLGQPVWSAYPLKYNAASEPYDIRGDKYAFMTVLQLYHAIV